MTQTQYVEYRDRGFWAYDVALGVFLKHLIDVTDDTHHAGSSWLAEASSWWRVVATVSDYGLTINADWSEVQIATFVELAEGACGRLAERTIIPSDEVSRWNILDGRGVFARGASEVHTAPVVELGHAIIALVKGQLPEPPPGRQWFYGVPEGRATL